MYIIYKNDNGKNIVIAPTLNCGLTIEQIAEKDVPKGKQYIITDTIPVDIEELKQQKWHEIKSIRDQKEQSGFPYSNKTLDSDSISVQRISVAAVNAQTALLLKLPFEISWKCADNTELLLDAQGILGATAALAQYSNSLHIKARNIKVLIDNATTAEEVQGITWVN